MDCWVERLPDTAVDAVLACLDHASVHAFELSGRICRETMQCSAFWRSSIFGRVACYEDPRGESVTLWKRMHCMRQRRVGFQTDSLLTGVEGCDSPNNFSVPPTWLLFKSRCWFWMEKLQSKAAERDAAALYVRQLHCGCGYHVPCFWASGASASQDTVASVDFSVRRHCFLSHVQIVPYQAFWLEGHPAFAPQRVSFTLLHQDGDNLHPYYQSPAFPVENAMALQQFELPKTVWTAEHCVLRVNLLGRTQRAPLDERPWITTPVRDAAGPDAEPEGENTRDYYCCLSYVNAGGFVVHDDTAKKSRRWWHH